MDSKSDQLIFIPRDAGFFSVFNFLVGSLTTKQRIYPLFNKDIFLSIHKKNTQFAYWTDNYNSWFDYFEPIKFFDDDIFHTSNQFHNKKITFGEIAPKEFKDPKTSAQLFRNNVIFTEWRKSVHNIYNQYIKILPSINEEVESWKNKNFITQEVVGIHYRHPVHCCESGAIYFQQYFDIIDSQYKDNELFLSTDSELAILVFKDKYKDRIKYITTNRISVDDLLSWSFKLLNYKQINSVGMLDGQGYELHQKILKNPGLCKIHTLDLLKEVLLLSSCRSLVCSLSNIPLALSYINPNLHINLIQ